MAAPRPFFVYELIDPRDSKPFYVGKGSGKRISDHFREAASGKNSHKCNKMRSIQAIGLEIQTRIVKEFRTEDAAYRFEARHIKAIGMDNLTNLAPGGRGPGGRAADPDLSDIDIFVLAVKKTAGFTRLPILMFGGERIEIGKALFDIGYNLYYKLVKSRGEQWVREKLARKNVTVEYIEHQAVNNAV